MPAARHDRDRPEPELLAPAGDWECLRAAVANGADAVYFGLSNFNARHRAANFSPEELPQVLAYLHDHNVRGYVTFNTLIFSGELDEAARLIGGIAEAGADAATTCPCSSTTTRSASTPSYDQQTGRVMADRIGIDCGSCLMIVTR